MQEEAKRIEEEQEKLEELVIQKIRSMTKDELRQAIYQLLFDGPEWQYDRFIEEFVDW